METPPTTEQPRRAELAAATPPRLQKGTAVDDDSAGPQPQQYDGTDGARPKTGLHLSREYGLLVPDEPEGCQDNTGPQVRGGGHGATRGTADEGQTETETGDKTGQCALLARSMQEDRGKEQSPPLPVARA